MDAISTGWGTTISVEVGESVPFQRKQCILKEGKTKIYNSTDPDCLNLIAGCVDQKARTNVCARGEAEDGTGVGICLGDSGGPLFVNNNGKALLVGVSSYVIGCAPSTGEPGVYVRVSSYLDFIMENTADGNC